MQIRMTPWDPVLVPCEEGRSGGVWHSTPGLSPGAPPGRSSQGGSSNIHVCGDCWDGGSHGRQHSRSSSGGQPPTGVSLLGYDFAFSGEDGPSQMALEDLAMFRAIPNCMIFYPSDAISTEHAVFLAANTKVFLRECWCRQKMCLGSAASLVLMV
ncbi:Transketolase-like [Parelaphostrongylus tenuis]|uniref:Transketolase-like n=1 Tax=Parelaphostrongylus tenuis TaxID=148309 RepID=A0AAD5QZ91_PARTN|nr:Transketolase-like [Parelaphostrongylus tenuis]